MTEHTERFKPIVWSYVQQYNRTQVPFIKKKLKEGLKDTLKKLTDQKVTMDSEEVMNACIPLEIDPFELLWTKRDVIGKDESGKSLLVWEHTTPLSEYFESLIACKSEQEISHVIENYSGVCWIMRHEDNALNAAGFRSSRPYGWEEAYKSCGIKLIRK
mgnify:CR=1 FL=1